MATGTGENTFTFWTPEEVQEAIPVDDFKSVFDLNPGIDLQQCEVYAPTTSQDALPQDALPQDALRRVSTVRESRLKTYPYHSIGRLLLICEDNDGSYKKRCATAFYIGNEMILTSAHAFYNTSYTVCKARSCFIPAMIDHFDVTGENYGCFKLFGEGREPSYVAHPLFDIQGTRPEYDICKVRLGEGSVIPSIELTPLEISVDVLPAPETVWTAIGYPASIGTMTMMRAQYVHGSYTAESPKVQMDIEVLGGMSGGPWIHGNSGQANGIQAGTLLEDGNTLSPYFSTELFQQLNIN